MLIPLVQYYLCIPSEQYNYIANGNSYGETSSMFRYLPQSLIDISNTNLQQKTEFNHTWHLQITAVFTAGTPSYSQPSKTT